MSPAVPLSALAEAARAAELWRQGLALEQQGRLDEALDRFREAIETGPYEEGWRYQFGSRFVERRPLAEVEAYYREAVRSDPKPQTSHYFWGVALARHRRFDEAALQLEKALAIDPAHEMSFEALGDVRAAQERFDEAIDSYRAAVAAHPEHRSAHERLAALLERLGRQEEAEHHRDKARASDLQTPRMFTYWGRALLRAGRVLPAIAELEKAVQAVPDDAEARALLQQARERLAEQPLFNVLLVSVDTLRADHLNGYGYRRRTTSPNIDALAADGLLFENHVASAPWTTPSQMSLLTSLYPAAHGMTRSLGELLSDAAGGRALPRLAAHHLTIAEALRAHGYATAAFTGGGTMAPGLGFDQGFDRYDTSMDKLGPNSVDELLSWIRSQRERPFFLFWHTFEVHAPYLRSDYLPEVLDPAAAGALTAAYEELAGPFARGAGLADRRRRIARGAELLEEHRALSAEVTAALYDGCILSFDRHFGRLVEQLRDAGLYERTLIVLTSDHGEELADHSTRTYDAHGHSLYEELIRVPLVVKLPGAARAGTRVAAVNRSIDVVPTILRALGLTLGADRWQGEPLQAQWETPGEAPPRIAFSEALAGRGEMKSVRTERYKYLEAIDPELVASRGRAFVPDPPAWRALFDLGSDPGEKRNLIPSPAGSEAEREAERLAALLRKLAAMPAPSARRTE